MTTLTKTTACGAAAAMVIGALVAVATAQPAAGSGSAAPAGSGSAAAGSAAGSAAQPDGIMTRPADLGPAPELEGQCVALARSKPEWIRGQCTAAVGEALTALPPLEAALAEARGTNPNAPVDPTITWAYAVLEQMWPLTKKIKAEDLQAQAQEAHDKSAEEIATNKRHVVLAYGAMWLLSAGFLLYLWRRQTALKAQIAELKRDLDAAVKDAK
jgi:hypothetical protein